VIFSFEQLISDLDSIGTDFSSYRGDFDVLLRKLVECACGHLSSIAIVVWTIEEGEAPAVRLDIGLDQFAQNGHFRVNSTHHDQLVSCSESGEIATEHIGQVVTGLNLIGRIFPFSAGTKRLILEILCDDSFFKHSRSSIDAVGQKICDVVDLHSKKAVEPSSSAESQAAINNKQLDRFLQLLYEQLSTSRVAAVSATDGRILAGCDRLSVVLFRGSGCKLLAISHVETIQRRAGLSKAMRKLANLSRWLPQKLILQGGDANCPDNMLDAFADFIAESRSQCVALIPLVPSDEHERTKHEMAHRKIPKKKSIGLLLVEQFTGSQDFHSCVERAELLRPHIASALKNANSYESVLFLPIWRWIGTKIRWLLGYPKIAIASVIAVLVATGICLAFVPATYRVHAEGRAMPEIQHEIYAKADGIVKEVLVVGGGRVKKGQTLLTLDNKELELDLVASKNKIVELSSQVESLGVKLQGALQLGDREQELAIEGERAAASIELSGTETRVRILEERISRLVVVSEFDGVVATFQPEEYLTGRPVKQGDLLLEVMEDEGPWRLELNISEYRMGHVLKSLEKYESLKVRYIAMTEVSQPKYAMLSSVATRADHNERLGAYVRAYAKIDRSEVPDQRIGAEVSAKIRCPDYSLFYSLCGDVVEFVERNVWW
jgi:hypothetical protein